MCPLSVFLPQYFRSKSADNGKKVENIFSITLSSVFRCVHISDIGIGYISTMLALSSLFLRWCSQIRDFGLQHICGMRNIRILSVAGKTAMNECLAEWKQIEQSPHEARVRAKLWRKCIQCNGCEEIIELSAKKTIHSFTAYQTSNIIIEFLGLEVVIV